ncbi:MAG: hypothetical protein ACOCUU_00295 [Nanoarchaeota archaeon]
MTEFKIPKPKPDFEGTGSPVNFADVRDVYAEAVEKLVLYDYAKFGKDWQNRALDILIGDERVYSPSSEGKWRGSNPPICTLMQEKIKGLDLITLQQSRRAYEANGNRPPVPNAYFEHGWAVIPGQNSDYKRNPEIASRLVEGLKSKGIEVGKGRVINFSQLHLQPVQDIRIFDFVINNTTTEDNVAKVGDYNWDYGFPNSASGAFRAILGSNSGWGVGRGNPEISGEDGRVVRFIAEGDAPEKLSSLVQEKDPLKERITEFRKRISS